MYFKDRNIAEYTELSIVDAMNVFKKLKLNERESLIARDSLTELVSRLTFLDEVGLSYLSLDRAAPTLSGGEAQRIRLAAQLGSNLRGVCYILDEPTTGLHFHDIAKLLDVLHELVDTGNTVVVIEHNLEVIKTADWILDLGPEGGDGGGELVASGTPEQVVKEKRSYTGQFLKELLVRRKKAKA